MFRLVDGLVHLHEKLRSCADCGAHPSDGLIGERRNELFNNTTPGRVLLETLIALKMAFKWPAIGAKVPMRPPPSSANQCAGNSQDTWR